MVNTGNFEVVAELSKSVLQKILEGAWENGKIPHSTAIAPGTNFGPYQVADGVLNIAKTGLTLDMAPADNAVRILLPSQIQVELANPPLSSFRLFNIVANVFVTAPIGTLPGTINVGLILDGLLRDKVAVGLVNIDPAIGAVSLEMIKEYVHNKYTDETIPHTYTQNHVPVGLYTSDVFVEIYDDPNDAAHQIEVSQPNPNQVKLRIPIYLRMSNITASYGLTPLSPMGVEAKIAVTAPLEINAGSVSAKLTQATIEVEDFVPAAGVEGSNYNLNKFGAQAAGMNLDDLLKIQIISRGQALVVAIGDIVVFVPTTPQIESFIGDQIHAALIVQGNIGCWTPQTPGGSPISIRDVTPKALLNSLAMCINNMGGGDPNAIVDFIPDALSCAVNVNGNIILGIIKDKIKETYGGFPAELDNLDGHKGQMHFLTPTLKDGAIHFEGSVTVYDALPCGIDVDADFWADIGLKWNTDGNGVQTLQPYVIDKDVDVDESVWVWLLGALTGGIIGVIIVAIVEHVADGIAEKIGGKIITNDVTGQTSVIQPWPQQLEGIGTVDSSFEENSIDIDPDSIIFPDGYVVAAAFASTTVASAEANGPYVSDGSSQILLTGGPVAPSTQYEWNLGDGTVSGNRVVPHTYAKHGVYVSKFYTNVTQPGGTHTREFAKVRVRSVTPQVKVGSDMVIDEGHEVDFSVAFTDSEWLSIHQAVFNFGDDSLPVEASITETKGPPYVKGTASAKHAYCTDGKFRVKAEVFNDDGSVGTGTFNVTVRNVAPKVEAGEDMFVYPCTPITLVANFTDPGWCEKHRGFWNFGDCVDPQTATIREINMPPEATGIAAATHTYHRLGTYMVECTVIDENDAAGRDRITVRVVDILNRDFEEGFRTRPEGIVANRWEPYEAAVSTQVAEATSSTMLMASMSTIFAYFNSEEFIVHGGQRSQKVTGGKRGRAGIYQKVGANVGWDYQISVWYHQRGGCRCRLGIDGTGGNNPDLPSIVWTEGNEDRNWTQLSERATAKSQAITIFIEAKFDDNKADAYFDDALLFAYPCILKKPQFKSPQKTEQQCTDWSAEKEPKSVGTEFEKNEFKFKSKSSMRIVEWGPPVDRGKLVIPSSGLEVKLPFLADQVSMQMVYHYHSAGAIEALSGDDKVIVSLPLTGDPGKISYMELKSEEIAKIRFKVEGQENLLVRLCASHPFREREKDTKEKSLIQEGTQRKDILTEKKQPSKI